MQHPHPAVAAAVVVHGRHVLLIRRTVPEPGLAWQFPAGKIQPGEDAEQAAVRETRLDPARAAAAVGDLANYIAAVERKVTW